MRALCGSPPRRSNLPDLHALWFAAAPPRTLTPGDAVADRLGDGEREGLLVRCFTKEALARSQHDREHHQTQFVDEVVFDQRVNEVP